ncbi:MAG: pentapeptide repeat-containing protein [Pikeienuella sp.]
MIRLLRKLLFFPFRVVWAPFQFISLVLRKLVAAMPKPELKDGWWDRFTAFAGRHYLTPIFTIAFVLFFPWLWLVFEVVLKAFEQVLADIPTGPDEKRAHFYALGLTFTGLGALLAPPFILIKTWVNERQTITTEQGLITDRFTRAVQQLGAMRDMKDRETGKEYSEPNLEVRLGALYALERIAQDSERDHIPMMETLCVYIRENAAAHTLNDLLETEWEPMATELDELQRGKHQLARKIRFGNHSMESSAWKTALSLSLPRADIQTALTIIGRRSPRRQVHETKQKNAYQLDLQGANLRRADLSTLALAKALLMNTRLEGSNLREAQLDGLNLRQARLEGAVLTKARLNGADLHKARLEGANLYQAQLERADLYKARLEGTNLGQARLEGANLRKGRLEGANLHQARLEGVDFHKARLEGTNLNSAQLERAYLTDARLNGADLRYARLNQANLDNANFEYTILLGASFKNANLNFCKLNKVNARHSDFTEAKNMTQDQVNALFGDKTTKIPPNLTRTNILNNEPLENPWDPDPAYKDWIARGAPPGVPLADD